MQRVPDAMVKILDHTSLIDALHLNSNVSVHLSRAMSI